MSGHTTGPWVIERGADGNQIIGTGRKFGAYVEYVAHVLQPGAALRMAGIADCSKANARLIAAAPDMYEMLQDLVEFLDDQADAEYFTDRAAPVPNDAMRLLVKVRAALAKAGRQP